MPSTRTVPIHLVHRALRTARHRGIDVDEVLRGTGISPSLVLSDRTRVTVDQMTRVMQRLWQVSDDELFGLGPGPIPRGTVRLLGMAMISSPDARTLLTRLDEFVRVLPAIPPLRVSFGDRETRLEVAVAGLDDPEDLLADLILSVTHRFLAWATGRRLVLTTLELPYPEPPYADDYDLIFGRMPRFGTGQAVLGFGNAFLPVPIIRSEDDLVTYLNNYPADLLTRRDYGSTTADQVRRILERGLSGDWPSSAEVARRLAVSLQHLRRRLRDEGTSISRIKEEIIRDAAIASLVRGEEPVQELSARLGFSEPSAFRRAFRRWTGSPPGAYRPKG
jgi:AraC-like DNA-binding protein